MPTFRTVLVPGGRKPYDTWLFAVVPDRVHGALGGRARIGVSGTVGGAAFRATISRGEGVYRFPVPRAIREAAGIGAGDRVEIVLDADPAERTVDVPPELAAVLAAEGLGARFADLPPSMRRAWAEHVAGAKRPETRARRAAEAPRGIRSRLFPGQRPAS